MRVLTELGGANCTKECKCENGAKCNPFNGSCICPKGWLRDWCHIPCETGFFMVKIVLRNVTARIIPAAMQRMGLVTVAKDFSEKSVIEYA
ncbi:hypothetical protein CEXT_812931 [Caerostris extrusa]|uniref:EGF-like domain-containing protein n=1 Tax=Caerostris extrusa TaxID=172846 RepID=A0AAV4NES0_CAEEX|nr:hypothetical protein CEXT_812931 [Caerostris extrusa]